MGDHRKGGRSGGGGYRGGHTGKGGGHERSGGCLAMLLLVAGVLLTLAAALS